MKAQPPSYAIFTQNGAALQFSGKDVSQAIRTARKLLPAGEVIIGAIRTDCVVTPEPDSGPFRVVVVRNQLHPAPLTDPAAVAPAPQP